jgi:formylglycine-generating enzyme required for sulfatase activity
MFPLLVLCLFVPLGITRVLGQSEVTLTLFRSQDTLTLLIPGDQIVNVQGLRFEATTITGNNLVQLLEELPSFRGLPYDRLPTPLCFHITRVNVNVPLPLECQTATTLTQRLADADVFWYDLSGLQERTILLILGETTRLCPAGQIRCDLTFAQPMATPTFFSPPTSTASSQIGSSVSPVIHNEDWVPVVETFDGVEMVLVPPGCFMMGGETGEADEFPTSQICFAVPFWIDRYEVTNEQFERFGGVAAVTSFWTDSNRPRENITWFEARDFCVHNRPSSLRLPTEAEWEYAARGVSNWIYPWGNEFVSENVVFRATSSDQTSMVGSRLEGASWVGAFDMSGNVREWVNSRYLPYEYDAIDGREKDSDTNELRVMRGGSFLHYYEGALRAADRDGVYANEGNYLAGFRCARDYE